MKTESRTPQFDLDRLYASPFAYERKYRPDGTPYWEELAVSVPATGIDVLDGFLRHLRAGYRSVKGIAARLGIDAGELTIFLRILTGQSAAEFIRSYTMRQAQEMLQYTDLTVDEIAKLCGFGNNSNLTQAFLPAVGVAPKVYRLQHQGHLDRGRFRMK